MPSRGLERNPAVLQRSRSAKIGSCYLEATTEAFGNISSALMTLANAEPRVRFFALLVSLHSLAVHDAMNVALSEKSILVSGRPKDKRGVSAVEYDHDVSSMHNLWPKTYVPRFGDEDSTLIARSDEGVRILTC